MRVCSGMQIIHARVPRVQSFSPVQFATRVSNIRQGLSCIVHPSMYVLTHLQSTSTYTTIPSSKPFIHPPSTTCTQSPPSPPKKEIKSNQNNPIPSPTYSYHIPLPTNIILHTLRSRTLAPILLPPPATNQPTNHHPPPLSPCIPVRSTTERRTLRATGGSSGRRREVVRGVVIGGLRCGGTTYICMDGCTVYATLMGLFLRARERRGVGRLICLVRRYTR